MSSVFERFSNIHECFLISSKWEGSNFFGRFSYFIIFQSVPRSRSPTCLTERKGDQILCKLPFSYVPHHVKWLGLVNLMVAKFEMMVFAMVGSPDFIYIFLLVMREWSYLVFMRGIRYGEPQFSRLYCIQNISRSHHSCRSKMLMRKIMGWLCCDDQQLPTKFTSATDPDLIPPFGNVSGSNPSDGYFHRSSRGWFSRQMSTNCPIIFLHPQSGMLASHVHVPRIGSALNSSWSIQTPFVWLKRSMLDARCSIPRENSPRYPDPAADLQRWNVVVSCEICDVTLNLTSHCQARAHHIFVSTTRERWSRRLNRRLGSEASRSCVHDPSVTPLPTPCFISVPPHALSLRNPTLPLVWADDVSSSNSPISPCPFGSWPTP